MQLQVQGIYEQTGFWNLKETKLKYIMKNLKRLSDIKRNTILNFFFFFDFLNCHAIIVFVVEFNDRVK